jgi:hypothetical protein
MTPGEIKTGSQFQKNPSVATSKHLDEPDKCKTPFSREHIVASRLSSSACLLQQRAGSKSYSVNSLFDWHANHQFCRTVTL